MAKIPFNDIIEAHTCPCEGLGPAVPVVIKVSAESKLWRKKVTHVESCNSEHAEKPAVEGDNIGFTLIFGNDGEIACYTDNRVPSVEDTLKVAAPINLRLVSLCLGCDYELWVSSVKPCIPKFEPCKLMPGAILGGEYTYTLQLRKKIDKCATPYFDIPCHYICSVSMLFEIECARCGKNNVPYDK